MALGCRSWALGLLLLACACGRSRDGDGASEARTWSRRLQGDDTTRDTALVELRRRRAAGVACVLALLEDPTLAKAPGNAAIREELVYILGEAGTTSSEAQDRLGRILRDADADVGVALAAARGLVLSWRMCHDLPLLEAYLALLRRVSRAEDVGKAASVNSIALAGCRLPFETDFVAALRAGANDPRTCAFCVGALRRYAGHETEFIGLYRELAQRLETEPADDDPVAEARKLALREFLGLAIAEAGAR